MDLLAPLFLFKCNHSPLSYPDMGIVTSTCCTDIGLTKSRNPKLYAPDICCVNNVFHPLSHSYFLTYILVSDIVIVLVEKNFKDAYQQMIRSGLVGFFLFADTNRDKELDHSVIVLYRSSIMYCDNLKLVHLGLS